MKSYDLVELKIAQLMYKVHNNLLCHAIQKLSEINGYKSTKKKVKTRTNIKQKCVSVRGSNLWNHFGTDLKSCVSLAQVQK